MPSPAGNPAVRKAVNRVKAKLEERHSPVSKDQSTVPIADAMRAYHERDMLSFAIPAHSGGRGPAPEFTRWAGMDAARFDLPMSHGVDTRDRAWKVQATAQELFAEAVGARQVMFSTNGSSLNAHVAVMTVAGPGETLVMARNGHKSAFAGLVMSGARPVYVDPAYDEELEIAHTVTPESLSDALDAHPEARAALVFTPSYYATSADVRALADVCHERDVPLVTDDAWGLDYELSDHPDLPEGALRQGSDLAIGSAHITRHRRGHRPQRVISRLLVGTAIEIQMAAPGQIGRWVRFNVRSEKRPTVTRGCLAIGTTANVAC